MLTLYELFCKAPTFPLILISAVIAFFAYRTTKHLARAKHAIDYETKYHETKELSDAHLALLAWSKSHTSSEMAELGEQPDHELVKHMRVLLNTWERAAIAVKRDVYDEDLLYNAYGSSVISIWLKTQPFIRSRQKKNPRLYVNFDWLAIRWVIRHGNAHSDDLKKLRKVEKILSTIK